MAIVLLSVVALALMVWFQVRQVRRVRLGRRAAVTEVERLLDEPAVVQDGIGYPTVTGRYRGERVKVELLVDTLALRKLPRLWLVVTVWRALPAVPVPVDVIIAPRTSDIASPGVAFRHEHPLPAHWPEDLRVASRAATSVEALYGIEALTELLHDPLTKSVVMAAGGVRVAHELARGEVSSHRVIRRANFLFDLGAEDARAVLDDAIAVADGVTALDARVLEPA